MPILIWTTPLPELKKMVHELGGLEPASSQDQLVRCC